VEAGANAARVKMEAEANAEKLRLEGEGEAKKVEQVGLAQARATQAQVNAFGGPQYQLTQQVMARFAEAVEHGRIDIVPKVMVAGSGEGKENPMAGNMLSALMAMMLSSKSGIEPLIMASRLRGHSRHPQPTSPEPHLTRGCVVPHHCRMARCFKEL
jgi:hypothetical protein